MAIGVLVYDEDEYLSEQLRVLLSEEQRLFSVFHFASLEDGVSYYFEHSNRIKCVLASPAFFDAVQTPPQVAIELGEESILEPRENDRFAINVYQNRTSILGDLMAILRSKDLVAHQRQNNSDIFILSFFSTQGGCGCSTLSYLSAVRAAQTSPTAYICLDAGPCTDALYHAPAQKGAEEFLFAIQERADAKTILSSALSRNEHGVYVFPAFSSLLDQAMLTAEDLEYLIEMLSGSGQVQNIILDLNSTMGAIERYALSASNCVAMVYTDDKMGAAKRRWLEQDPNYTTYPFVEKEVWVGNRCKTDRADGQFDLCFPVLSNFENLNDIRDILTVSPLFANNCDRLIARA